MAVYACKATFRGKDVLRIIGESQWPSDKWRRRDTIGSPKLLRDRALGNGFQLMALDRYAVG